MSDSCLLGVCEDPVDEVGHLSVDAGVVGAGAAVAPGHDAGEVRGPGVVADEGAARVSLAGVLAALGQAGADHGVLDLAGAIGITALIIGDDGHLDPAEGAGGGAALGGGAPAGDGALAAGGVAGCGDGDGLHVVVEHEGLGHLQKGDVVGDGKPVVVLVLDDLSQDDLLLVALGGVQVVLAGNDLRSRRRRKSVTWRAKGDRDGDGGSDV